MNLECKMIKETPLVDKKYVVEKFQGKGGWTFVRIPEIVQQKKTAFGWLRVRGTIDDVEIKNYNLQSMGNGCLFLPLKAGIRKKINKKEGDVVRVVLYADPYPTKLPQELKLCLLDEPGAYESFLHYSSGAQQSAIEWIYSAKTDAIKVERIAKMIEGIVSRNPSNG